jgi:hypothetical protein
MLFGIHILIDLDRVLRSTKEATIGGIEVSPEVG